MPNISAMTAKAHKIKESLDELLLRGSVLDSGEHRVAATLYLTIAEQFAATLHLIEGGFSSHASAMVRSMLEGHANLLNLIKDSAFVDQIRYDNARADIVLFTEYAADSEMQQDPDAQRKLAEWKAQADPIKVELEGKGYGKLDVYQRFKKANILSTYVAYRVFCSFSHNQLTTLLARHAGKFELRYHAEAPKELIVGLLDIAVRILCQSVVTASRYTNLTEAELKEVLDAADAADAAWSEVQVWGE
ncbi:DUF5677 domain-containing protein [Chromobacterium sphagni]|nr:DUF5677 domain-containing protein [Chromobacterium sphagni]